MLLRTITLLSLLALQPLSVPLLHAQPIPRSEHLPATTPWDLSALGATPSFEWVDNAQPVRSVLYTSEPYKGNPTRVFAYYASPATLQQRQPNPSEKFPAMVLIHGGGGTAFREWAELWAKNGYAAIAMDTAGYRPNEGQNAHDKKNRSRLTDAGPDQSDQEKFGSVDLPPNDQWPYHAVAAAIRAHSLIRSFPEVDPERTGVTGISWGGYLTSIVAGVDSRFKLAVPVYGCGFLHENSTWLDRLKKMSPAQNERWVSLWDPSRYLGAAKMPMLFINGTNDFAYPLDSYMKSFALPKGPKQLRITVNMPHGHQQGWAPKEIALFADHLLKNGPPLPQLSNPQRKDAEVHVHCTTPVPLRSAAIHTTSDEGPINKRKWLTTSASVSGETIVAKAPDAATTAWFVTVTDTRDATVSTEVNIRK
jgi:cephalosporin-C deacetylase-like acetyl esterase